VRGDLSFHGFAFHAGIDFMRSRYNPLQVGTDSPRAVSLTFSKRTASSLSLLLRLFPALLYPWIVVT
jgi:hypothetical protein